MCSNQSAQKLKANADLQHVSQKRPVHENPQVDLAIIPARENINSA